MSAAQNDTRIAGLCAACRHVRVIDSARGSRFFMCQRGLTDPVYPKYPRLPILICRGFELCSSASSTETPAAS